MVANLVSEYELKTKNIQGLSYGSVRDHVFRGELKSLLYAIYSAAEMLFCEPGSHDDNPHRPQRRSAAGGPESMDLCVV